jgi:hypothetical protein
VHRTRSLNCIHLNLYFLVVSRKTETRLHITCSQIYWRVYICICAYVLHVKICACIFTLLIIDDSYIYILTVAKFPLYMDPSNAIVCPPTETAHSALNKSTGGRMSLDWMTYSKPIRRRIFGFSRKAYKLCVFSPDSVSD